MITLVFSVAKKLLPLCIKLSHFRCFCVVSLMVVHARSLKRSYRLPLLLGRMIVKAVWGRIISLGVLNWQRVYPVSAQMYRLVRVVKRSGSYCWNFILLLYWFTLRLSKNKKKTYTDRCCLHGFNPVLHDLVTRTDKVAAITTHAAYLKSAYLSATNLAIALQCALLLALIAWYL